MRKKLLASVLAAGILSTSSAFAAEATAETMFSTVPKDHWAYGAVQQLVHDGLINGYGDDDFRGEKPISRYEMAKFVAMAMTNAKKASMEDKKTMDDLQQEYTLELTKLNVRLQNLEARTSSFKWFGDARVRYQSGTASESRQTDQSSSKTGNRFESRVRLGFYGEPAENVSVFGRIKAENTTNVSTGTAYDTGKASGSNAVSIESLAISWNRGNTIYTVGRPLLSLGQGLIWWENPIDGLMVVHNFNKNIKATLAYGDLGPGIWADKYVGGLLADLSWNTSRKTNVTLTYRDTNSNDYTTQAWNADGSWKSNGIPYKFRQVAMGFNTQLTDKYNLRAEAITNRASGLPDGAQRNGWWTQLTYGHLVWKRAHTFELYAQLFSFGNWAMDRRWAHHLDVPGNDFNGGNGQKGWGIGGKYMLAPNTNLEINYYKTCPYNSGKAGFSSYKDQYTMALSYSF